MRAVVLGLTGVLYTIPSLAAFALLLPFTGLSRTTAIIPLATYTLLILIRNIVAGLDGVPRRGAGRRDRHGILAACASCSASICRSRYRRSSPGYGSRSVTVIGLIPVAALIGQGGLGQLMRDGFERDFRTPLIVGVVLTVALAIAADLFVLGIQRW